MGDFGDIGIGLNTLLTDNDISVSVYRYRSNSSAKGLIKHWREMFSTYGIPEEIASDQGTEFTANETKQFLSTWQVNSRLSSVAFPHSNCRAELAVR